MNNRLFVPFLLLVLAGSLSHAVQGEAPPSAVVVDVPEYIVEKIGGWDYADIPGGGALLVVGKPRVPFYSVSIEYPSGCRVQVVAMRERSGLMTAKDLNLSTVTWIPDRGPSAESVSLPVGDAGWYPEMDFSWRVFLDLDGSSTLVIDVFPFYYYSETKEVKFYKHYEFDIVYIFSTVSILDLATDKITYDPRENVTVNVLMNVSGESMDVVAGAMIKRYGTEEVVDGLPLRTFHDMVGGASFSMTWDTKGFPTGDYYVEVVLNDTLGNWLDRRTCGFRVGRPLINVTGFAVEPQHFEIGDAIRMSLDVRNAGSVTVSGRCVFIVREAGKEVESSYNNFTSLAPGKSLRFSSSWNSTSAKKGTIYYVTGYVSYESRTTYPMVAIISTNLFPVASFNYSPTKVGLGESVAFDASDSNDPDGNIASYRWSFGDGGEGFGATATHAYHGLGSYEVVLNVTDNEGASSTARQVLTVVMSYTLSVSSNVQVAIAGSGMYKEGDEVELSAPASVSMPGALGLIGARYVFKEWVGALNSTEETVTLVFSGYRPMLEMRAVYVEDYTGAIVVVSVAAVAAVGIAAIYLRKRERAPKQPQAPPPPPPPSRSFDAGSALR